MNTAILPAPVAQLPDARGRFGPYGGRYVPETLMFALEQLEQAYLEAKHDPAFQAQFRKLLNEYVGRPSRLYFAERLTREAGGAQIWLKREDLNHTGAHKINNAIGQGLLTLRMGKKRIIAETGAGQHGVASATAAALFGLPCRVYMGTEDIRRQELNVFKMQAMGTEVFPVESGSRTLRDAINEAMREWMASVVDTHYIIGSAIGPHPFPMIVRDFQSVIGEESREQCLEIHGRLPDVVVACVGGGSNSAGMFYPFINDSSVEIVGVEAGGRKGVFGEHAATISHGSPGVLHGTFTYVLQDDDGQTAPVHSVSAGLDYPGVGPEHSYWHDSGRVRYTSINDEESLEGFKICSRLEGILPALETAHGIVETMRIAASRPRTDIVVLCFSGRGDKDCAEVARLLEAGREMNPIDALFSDLRKSGHKAFMPFLPAGDPDLATTAQLLKDVAAAGANLIEIGFPFSDPIADGSVIQASYTRALDRGLKLADIFTMIREVTSSPGWKVPLVSMVSYSLIYRRGVDHFLDQALACGLSGAVVPDLPGEEAADLSRKAAERNFKLILLVTPTTDPTRAKMIVELCSGFVYCVSVVGITGERDRLPEELRGQLQHLRTLTNLPLCVGFGVSKPAHVRHLKEIADGVIVGSALVKQLEQKNYAGVAELVRSLSSALEG